MEQQDISLDLQTAALVQTVPKLSLIRLRMLRPPTNCVCVSSHRTDETYLLSKTRFVTICFHRVSRGAIVFNHSIVSSDRGQVLKEK